MYYDFFKELREIKERNPFHISTGERLEILQDNIEKAALEMHEWNLTNNHEQADQSFMFGFGY